MHASAVRRTSSEGGPMDKRAHLGRGVALVAGADLEQDGVAALDRAALVGGVQDARAAAAGDDGRQAGVLAARARHGGVGRTRHVAVRDAGARRCRRGLGGRPGGERRPADVLDLGGRLQALELDEQVTCVDELRVREGLRQSGAKGRGLSPAGVVGADAAAVQPVLGKHCRGVGRSIAPGRIAAQVLEPHAEPGAAEFRRVHHDGRLALSRHDQARAAVDGEGLEAGKIEDAGRVHHDQRVESGGVHGDMGASQPASILVGGKRQLFADALQAALGKRPAVQAGMQAHG